MRRQNRICIGLWVAMAALAALMACQRHTESPLLLKSPAPTDTPLPVSFAPVQRLLTDNCTQAQCHNLQFLAGQLSLLPDGSRGNLVGVKSMQKPGAVLVVPHDPQSSYLLDKLLGKSGIRGSRMPIGRAYLDREQELLIWTWIADGALR